MLVYRKKLWKTLRKTQLKVNKACLLWKILKFTSLFLSCLIAKTKGLSVSMKWHKLHLKLTDSLNKVTLACCNIFSFWIYAKLGRGKANLIRRICSSLLESRLEWLRKSLSWSTGILKLEIEPWAGVTKRPKLTLTAQHFELQRKHGADASPFKRVWSNATKQRCVLRARLENYKVSKVSLTFVLKYHRLLRDYLE